MFSWLFFIFSNQTQNDSLAQVKIEESEVEMIWIPEDWSGPIVAAPFEDSIF